jgi:hypothetical protein
MYTSAEFQAVREALLKCSNADRAFLRRWILRRVDDHGQIVRGAVNIEVSRMPAMFQAIQAAQAQVEKDCLISLPG